MHCALHRRKSTISAGGDGTPVALATNQRQDDAVTLFFREKAFWTFSRGQRLNDERRLMRQYGRTEDQVYPTGNYFKGGTYGHTIQLPVTNSELRPTRSSRAALDHRLPDRRAFRPHVAIPRLWQPASLPGAGCSRFTRAVVSLSARALSP